MSDIRRLVEMMRQQMEAQRQQTEILQKQMLEQQGAKQKEVHAQREAYQQQMEALVKRLTTTSDSSAGTHPAASIPPLLRSTPALNCGQTTGPGSIPLLELTLFLRGGWHKSP